MTTPDPIDPGEDAALAGLASLAFGPEGATRDRGATRHRAFVAIKALELDLSDPEQRFFGDYELLEQLGVGGMGVVYRARQQSLEREVAIKLLSAGPWATQDFIERFRREARSAARLQHPNIVAIHEFGSRDELNYFSMALVRGPDLAQVLAQRGRLPPREAAKLVRRIAEALDYAHRLGVLHLDLKPGNVLIDEAGEPQVADFGLARRLDDAFGADSNEVSGTPNYMAPEQIEPERHRLSAATDLYGLGAILYELLSGQPPFVADTPRQTWALVLAGNVRSLRSHDPAIPLDLEAICLKCLAKTPDARYQNARALADDLGRFLEGRTVSVRPLDAWQRLGRWTRREPRLAATGALAALALVVGLVATSTQWQRAERSATAARQQTWSTRAEAAWRMVQEGRSFDALPLVFDNLREREAQGDTRGAALERLRLGTLQRSGAQLIDAIATSAEGSAVALDRTGTHVAAAVGDGELRLYAVDDGRELWRVDTRKASHFWPPGALGRVDFTRDGRHLIVDRGEPELVTRPSGHDNMLVDARDGRVLLPPRERFVDFRDATYSADGGYAVLRNTRREAQLFRVAGWQPLTPRRRFSDANDLWRVGDGGRYVALAHAEGRFELWDPRTFKTRYSVSYIPARAVRTWATQPDGVLLALGHVDGTVRVLDTEQLTFRTLEPTPHARVDWLSFSEDGRWLTATSAGRAFLWDVENGVGGALPAGRARSGSDVRVDAASGTVFAASPPEAVLWTLPETTATTAAFRKRIDHARMLVPQLPQGDALRPHGAAFAPAAALAASIDMDGELRLWRWRDLRPLRARGAPQTVADLHFDGRHVVAVEGRIARVITVDGERAASPVMTHPQPVSLATLAPDGGLLLTVSGRELRVFDWRAGRLRFAPVALADSPLRVVISPDSRLLAVTTGGYRHHSFQELVSTLDLRTGKAHATGVPLPGPLAGLRFAPDGRHLLHWRGGELGVRDAMTLQPVGDGFRFDSDMAARQRMHAARLTGFRAGRAPFQETAVHDAALSVDGARLTVLTAGSRHTNTRLLQLDARSGRTSDARELGTAVPLRLLPHENGYEFIVLEPSGARWLDIRGGNRALPSAPGNLLMAHALSRDGRWLASNSTGGVLLADRETGEWATAPLPTPLPIGDAIAQLAFAPDGGSLLARSHHGRWLWWPLLQEPRSTATLRQRLAHLLPAAAADSERFAPALPPEERAALRAADPGAPRAPPQAAVAAALPPPVDAALTPGFGFVDLRAAINRDVDATHLVYNDDALGYFASVPTGVQRFLGVDFDVRGVVVVQMRDGPNVNEHFPVRSPTVRSPQPRFAAMHLLLGACCMLQGRPKAPFGFLAIGYADGGIARVPILYHRHVWEPWNDPGDAIPARVAWVETNPRAHLNFESAYRLYAARLINPHPEREVATLAFEASDLAWSGPLIFAATTEIGAVRHQEQ